MLIANLINHASSGPADSFLFNHITTPSRPPAPLLYQSVLCSFVSTWPSPFLGHPRAHLRQLQSHYSPLLRKRYSPASPSQELRLPVLQKVSRVDQLSGPSLRIYWTMRRKAKLRIFCKLRLLFLLLVNYPSREYTLRT
jgi:hypothetical protein